MAAESTDGNGNTQSLNLNRGGCTCGSVWLHLSLPEVLPTYAARACNCDYCSSRGIAWVSDPAGNLVINSEVALSVSKQGSNQASFLACSQCDDVVAVTVESKVGRIGAMNATLLMEYDLMSAAQATSPQSLSAEEKVVRWERLWQPVEVTEGAS